jgi:hypothetical protein
LGFKKDLSKEWMQFLLYNVPNYKTQIYTKFENNRQEILKSLEYRIKDKDEQIKRLNQEKIKAINHAKEEIKKLDEYKNIIDELDACKTV